MKFQNERNGLISTGTPSGFAPRASRTINLEQSLTLQSVNCTGVMANSLFSASNIHICPDTDRSTSMFCLDFFLGHFPSIQHFSFTMNSFSFCSPRLVTIEISYWSLEVTRCFNLSIRANGDSAPQLYLRRCTTK
jgi:hypothetical protein